MERRIGQDFQNAEREREREREIERERERQRQTDRDKNRTFQSRKRLRKDHKRDMNFPCICDFFFIV